jgi:hypothetical protein
VDHVQCTIDRFDSAAATRTHLDGFWTVPVGSINVQANGVNEVMVNRSAGIAMMAGFILLTFAALFYPGVRTIDRVDQTDYAGSLAVVADHASLAQFVNVTAIVAALLFAYSFLVLFRAAGKRTGIAGSMMRFGIGIGLVGWAIGVVGFGVRHMVIHLLQRGYEEAQLAEQLRDFALTTHVVNASLFFSFIVVFSSGCFLLGAGLASQCKRMDSLKFASYGLMLSGFGQIAVYLVALFFPEVGLSNLINYYFVSLMIGILSLFVIGVAMYRGRPELAV